MWHFRGDKLLRPNGLSQGRTSCVGRHLALAQIRLVAAAFVFHYRIKFAPGENDDKVVERDMKDQLTAQPGICRLVFERR